MTITDIRNYFADQHSAKAFVVDKTGVSTLELLGASFCADEPSIFGKLNHEYIQHELDWYLSQSLNVNDIPGKVPTIWKSVATPAGVINSNYGYLVFSDKNYSQYEKVLVELIRSPNSRRAVTIYTRPSMHSDWQAGGMSDFICTNAVQYLIRDGKMHCVVQMRSNDVWAGYRNDYAWQKYVLDKLVIDYNDWTQNYSEAITAGDITWQVGSLHLYENQFYLVDHYAKTGEHHITKKDYNILYNKS
jgi:thymidylate synthase